ncbi:hypothetical protein JCM33774_30030 [Actinophytocola sp. KF-1]
MSTGARFRETASGGRRALYRPFLIYLGGISMKKKIKVRKAGTVRLTSAATLYDCGCAVS